MQRYNLMNKDHAVAVFATNSRQAFSEEVNFTLCDTTGTLPLGFKDITTWIEGRKATKHANHLKALMRQLGCDDNEGYLRITHATTINDTFWVKAEEEITTWNEVSLYSNPFNETISKLAFEGVGLYNIEFSSTSPEMSCEGSFRKCFCKEKKLGEFNSDIFLYKRANELGQGFEPYCEQMASEIAKIISPKNSVAYELTKLHGKIATKCNLFTNERRGYASFTKINEGRADIQKVFDYYNKIGSEQEFREMLVIDALCFNQDRHSGNFGVCFDNDTLEIKGIAPVFDLNMALLPYVYEDEFNNIGDKLLGYSPKLGEDFTRIGQIGLNDSIRERVKDMQDFRFSFRGDDIFTSKRVKQIEETVHRQAQALLSNQKLRTSDVFYSKRLKEEQQEAKERIDAQKEMTDFENYFEEKIVNADFFVSTCNEEHKTELYVEYLDYMISVDFYSKAIETTKNMCPIALSNLVYTNNKEQLYQSIVDTLLSLGKDNGEMPLEEAEIPLDDGIADGR